ncbi:hypothetical protein L2E82_09091 [Cichorium intybus]|uniref:Uncharacterized protein n=1 Tax=Cichorium intybus TaxID=13427 RepID=A0ACB9G8J1_CICIN|nr:hypothetical protein L2E82_09091 [Cichorium intybus]
MKETTKDDKNRTKAKVRRIRGNFVITILISIAYDWNCYFTSLLTSLLSSLLFRTTKISDDDDIEIGRRDIEIGLGIAALCSLFVDNHLWNQLLYLHCTLRNSEPLERLFPASSYWTPTKVKEKLDYLSTNGGYANVEVIQSYVDYVDEEEDEENMTLGNVIRRRIQKKKMKEQEEKITVVAVIRKKIDKKKMRSDVTLKKKKKITKKKSDVQQLEGK